MKRQSFEFGEFHLDKESGRLFKDGRIVPLGHRAFMILTLLAERAGDVVTQKELIEYVWPKTVVEENNLRVQISAVRKALRVDSGQPDYIRNIPGRGYQLVVPDVPTMSVAYREVPELNLDFPPCGLVGRDDALNVLRHELYSARRLITIVGTCGIGKTSVASAVSLQTYDYFGGRVLLLDAEALPSIDVLSQAVTAELTTSNKAVASSFPTSLLTDSHECLLVLDNCGSLIDELSIVVTDLLYAMPGLKILAVSHEPLRISQEFIYRLSALQCPPPAYFGQNAYQLFKFPAVALFIQKAIQASDNFSLTARDGHALAQICRALAGLPLAIEIAASYVAKLGLQRLATALGSSLSLLLHAEECGNPRTRSLRQSLERRFRTLSATEKHLLFGLAEHSEPFDLELAIDRLAPRFSSQEAIVEGIFSLANRSFLDRVDAEAGVFLMSAFTRAYALEIRRIERTRAASSLITVKKRAAYEGARHWSNSGTCGWRYRFIQEPELFDTLKLPHFVD